MAAFAPLQTLGECPLTTHSKETTHSKDLHGLSSARSERQTLPRTRCRPTAFGPDGRASFLWPKACNRTCSLPPNRKIHRTDGERRQPHPRRKEDTGDFRQGHSPCLGPGPPTSVRLMTQLHPSGRGSSLLSSPFGYKASLSPDPRTKHALGLGLERASLCSTASKCPEQSTSFKPKLSKIGFAPISRPCAPRRSPASA